jgi:hypothetical protein
MSTLTEYAKTELELAGLFDEDADYGGLIAQSVVELIEVFAKQGHSGFSGPQVAYIFNKLALFQPLTAITSNPDEWLDRTEESGCPMWQSKRSPSVFSKDAGQTWYDLNAIPQASDSQEAHQ